MFAPAICDAQLEHEPFGLVIHAAAHAGVVVWLIVKRTRHPSHQASRHEFAHEDDAALVVVADVEAQIQFGEVPEAWPGHAEHFGVEKIKRH